MCGSLPAAALVERCAGPLRSYTSRRHDPLPQWRHCGDQHRQTRWRIPMSLPTLTPEQRAQALEKAAQARQLRAKLKEDLAAGKVTLPALMDDELGPRSEEQPSELQSPTRIT